MITLKPGDLGIDCSGFRLDTAAKVSAAKAAGCRFLIRYSAGVGGSNYNTHFKLITPAEHRALLADGFDIIANSEWYETRVTEGYNAGLADGKADLALWKSCGHARGATIYPSWDAAAVSSKFTAVDNYIKGFRAGLGGYYNLYVGNGIYAGTPYLKHAIAAGVIKRGWRPNASSWSNDGLPYQPDVSTVAKRTALVASALGKTPAHIYQTGNYWFSKNADENLLLRANVGSHWDAVRAATAPAPAPAPAPVKPHYHLPQAIPTNALVSKDGAWAWFANEDGRIDVRHNGVHVRYI
jgi:hypothetical protein